MISESKKFFKNCFWFSTLVSKESNLKRIYKLLEQVGANQVKMIPLGTNNKSSRIVAWTFFTEDEKQTWIKKRW
jgi:23S rRNA (adenine1618-N6)-methyltransferase